MLESFERFLKTQDVEYKKQISMSKLSPMKLGGEIEFFVKPYTLDSLVNIVCFLEKEKIRYLIVGRMTNILPSDGKYDGVFVSTSHLCKYELIGEHLALQCGAVLSSVSCFLAERGLSGFEELSGIPGSVGGLAIMNAGAYGREISDIIESVTVYDFEKGKIRIMAAADIKFGYRTSSLVDFAVLSVTLRLIRSSTERINSLLAEYKEKRRNTQPLGFPTLGSTFKRPPVGYASKMIDECGLKGLSIGGAQISEKHAGFIINRGGATASDVVRLMEIAEEAVFRRFGVKLEREIIVI